MALDILEWGVIAVMGVSILIWGPEKVPEIAKTLGRAKKEFDGATKQLQGITKELQTGMNNGNFDIDSISNALIGAGNAATPGTLTPEEMAQASAGSPTIIGPNGVTTTTLPPLPAKKSADQMLIEMAKSLRIETQGLTREEVSKAIMERVASPKPELTAPVEVPQTTTTDSTQAESEAMQPAPIVNPAEIKAESAPSNQPAS